jgi:CRP/FNR family transcriptional regulator, dissimilatory nitrate respiration regulator
MNSTYKTDMILYTLSRSMFGSGLKQSDLLTLAGVCSLRSVEKNSYLFHQQELASHFYIVHSGAIKVHRMMVDGQEQVIHVFRATESFAEVALSGQLHYPVSAAAIEPSQVIAVECGQLRSLIHRIPDLSLQIIASMSMHLKYLVGRLGQQKYEPTLTRVAEWLLDQTEGNGKDRFMLPSRKRTLASQLGMTSETFSRCLTKLKKQGLIREESSLLTVVDRNALARLKKGEES